MKSSNEYLESIYRKKELVIMKKEKERKRTRRVVLTLAPVVLCGAILAIILPGMLKKGDLGVVYAKDMMNGIVAQKIAAIDGIVPDDLFRKAYVNFTLKLFNQTVDNEENVLVSPLSIYIALAMTANGADGETRKEMEEVLGVDINSLNKYLLNYTDKLTAEPVEEEVIPSRYERYGVYLPGRVKLANSIWLRDDKLLTVKEDFLQINADYYGVAAYKAAFDKKTVDDINNWVKENTDGMIENVVEKLNKDEMLHLINAMIFEAGWEQPYQSHQVKSGTFTNAQGVEEAVTYLTDVQYTCIKDENVLGFVRPYQGDYDFVALLPNEGVSITDYVKTLTVDKWIELMEQEYPAIVPNRIPKFEYEYSEELSEELEGMGINAAFDANAADFSGMGSYDGMNLCIGTVTHKTYIVLNEYGTKAGAVTDIGMLAGSPNLERIEIILDRPFVYAIIDRNTKLPLFVGTVMSVE